MKSSKRRQRGRGEEGREEKDRFQILQSEFKNLDLLRIALIHRSFLNEAPEALDSNERIEFLGDAVLNLIVSEELFRLFPDFPEGKLTKLRTSLICGPCLAQAAKRLKLGEHLVLGRGEEKSGGREKQSNLSQAFEAVVGAIFLDRGLEAARSFILEALSEEFERIKKGEAPFPDYKSEFQEIVQAKFKTRPVYRVVKIEGPQHKPTFTVEVEVEGEILGVGEGRSKRAAEQEAARKALLHPHITG